ncbi:MAG: DUF2339 domain-containing protein [Fimbriimonadales bacterium]|nr:DUF2339 domain-containing protein [Fimbriimonadales bacterium]MDW8051037.1 DUF2339 domain-containing protein [Armatimonadota bacterium]
MAREEVRQELETIKAQLRQLYARVQALEQQLAAERQRPTEPPAQMEASSQRGAVPSSEVQPTSLGASLRVRAVVPTPEAELVQPVLEEEAASFERTLGGKVALYTGVTLLFLAAAFFLSWAWAKLPPVGRLALSYLGGFALIGIGGLARHRSEGWFVDGLMGAGLAVLYLSTWAGWERYALMGFAQAFASAAFITVFGVISAVWRNSQTLAVVATVGGFSAPVWLRGEGGGGSPLNFFSYLTVLNAGMLSVAVWRKWEGQKATCLAATIAILGGWMVASYQPKFAALALGFITLNYVVFGLAYLLPNALRRQPTKELELVQFAVASLGYLPTSYALARQGLPADPGVWLAGAGVAYVLVSGLKYRLRDAPAAATLLTLGVASLVAAVAIEFQRPVQAVLFSLITAGLLITSLRYQTKSLYGYGVVLALVAAVVVMVVLFEPIRMPRVVLNEHGIALLAWLLGLGATQAVLYRDMRLQRVSPLDGVFPREVLAATGALGVVFGALWFSTEQTLYAFELVGRKGAPAAHLLVSLEWTLLGAALLISGVRVAIRALRLMGLGTLALTVGKLFLYDLSFLEMPYRVFSFAGLGLTLIGVAWLYSRYGGADTHAPTAQSATPPTGSPAHAAPPSAPTPR